MTAIQPKPVSPSASGIARAQQVSTQLQGGNGNVLPHPLRETSHLPSWTKPGPPPFPPHLFPAPPPLPPLEPPPPSAPSPPSPPPIHPATSFTREAFAALHAEAHDIFNKLDTVNFIPGEEAKRFIVPTDSGLSYTIALDNNGYYTITLADTDGDGDGDGGVITTRDRETLYFPLDGPVAPPPFLPPPPSAPQPVLPPIHPAEEGSVSADRPAFFEQLQQHYNLTDAQASTVEAVILDTLENEAIKQLLASGASITFHTPVTGIRFTITLGGDNSFNVEIGDGDTKPFFLTKREDDTRYYTLSAPFAPPPGSPLPPLAPPPLFPPLDPSVDGSVSADRPAFFEQLQQHYNLTDAQASTVEAVILDTLENEAIKQLLASGASITFHTPVTGIRFTITLGGDNSFNVEIGDEDTKPFFLTKREDDTRYYTLSGPVAPPPGGPLPPFIPQPSPVPLAADGEDGEDGEDPLLEGSASGLRTSSVDGAKEGGSAEIASAALTLGIVVAAVATAGLLGGVTVAFVLKRRGSHRPQQGSPFPQVQLMGTPQTQTSANAQGTPPDYSSVSAASSIEIT